MTRRIVPDAWSCPSCPVDRASPGTCDVCGRNLVKGAGLLVTPEQRAVLDAAEAETQAETLYYPGVGPGKYITLQLARKQRRDAVDALHFATPKDR